MLSISWRLMLRVIAGASVIVSIIWLIFEPGFRSSVAVLTTLVVFVGLLIGSDTPISIPTSEKTKSTREERRRQRMLKRVKNDWIKGVLEPSLRDAVLIELGLKKLQMPGKPDCPLPPGTKIMDVIDEMGQTLLILGEPGSGKTTMLLELARDAIARAEGDAKHQIPVMFNLSSWTDTKQTITDWLVGELDTEYGIRKKIASDWIENDDLLLLLDGLDEVLPERREACARAINDFRREHGLLTPLVVCCRSEEYKTLSNRIYLGGAVCLKPLTEKQVGDYLDRMGQELAGLRTTLKGDSELCELAQTPLMLSIMTLAYRGMSVHDLQPLETIDARRKHIFDNYVERMLQPRIYRTVRDHLETDSAPDRKHDKRFSKEETIHWLSWLANRRSPYGQTVFLIEWMQPDWLPRVQRRIMAVGVAVLIGLLGGLLTVLMLFGLLIGRFVELLPVLLLFGLFGGLLGLLGYNDNIRPIETLRFSRPTMRTSLVCVGLFFVLFYWHSAGPFAGLFAGLFFWLSAGLVEGEIVTRTFPNEGIYRSAYNALLAGLFGGLFGGLFHWLHSEPSIGLIFCISAGLSAGLFIGLWYGGLACIQHLVLRIMLWRNGSAPLNYVRFLDYAAGCIFLRKVGGGYIFVHRLLLEYFASLEPEEEGG